MHRRVFHRYAAAAGITAGGDGVGVAELDAALRAASGAWR